LYLSIRTVIEMNEVIIDAYHFCKQNFIQHNAVKFNPTAEEIIGDHHHGFRNNRPTTHLILCIRQMVEKKWEFSKAMHQLFIDFKKPMIPVGGRFCIIFLDFCLNRTNLKRTGNVRIT
jgi:hypothetical protein